MYPYCIQEEEEEEEEEEEYILLVCACLFNLCIIIEEEEKEEEHSLVSNLADQHMITKRLAKNRQEGGSCVEGTHPATFWNLHGCFQRIYCFAVDCRA